MEEVIKKLSDFIKPDNDDNDDNDEENQNKINKQ